MNNEYLELLNELKKMNSTLKQIEQNTQNNGNLVIPKELIAMLMNMNNMNFGGN